MTTKRNRLEQSEVVDSKCLKTSPTLDSFPVEILLEILGNLSFKTIRKKITVLSKNFLSITKLFFGQKLGKNIPSTWNFCATYTAAINEGLAYSHTLMIFLVFDGSRFRDFLSPILKVEKKIDIGIDFYTKRVQFWVSGEQNMVFISSFEDAGLINYKSPQRILYVPISNKIKSQYLVHRIEISKSNSIYYRWIFPQTSKSEEKRSSDERLDRNQSWTFWEKADDGQGYCFDPRVSSKSTHDWKLGFLEIQYYEIEISKKETELLIDVFQKFAAISPVTVWLANNFVKISHRDVITTVPITKMPSKWEKNNFTVSPRWISSSLRFVSRNPEGNLMWGFSQDTFYMYKSETTALLMPKIE